MSRVQNDVQQLQEFLSIFVLVLSDMVVLVGIVVAMLLMNAELALITFSVVPVLLVMMVLWQRYALRTFMRVRREVAHVNSELQENISGMRVIQSLDRQDENLRQFDDANRRYVDTSMNATRLSAALNPSVELVSAVSTALVIIFGGLMVLDGNIEVVGVLVAFAPVHPTFLRPHTLPHHAVRATPKGRGFWPAYLRDSRHGAVDTGQAWRRSIAAPHGRSAL